jgi:hypothetical protein
MLMQQYCICQVSSFEQGLVHREAAFLPFSFRRDRLSLLSLLFTGNFLSHGKDRREGGGFRILFVGSKRRIPLDDGLNSPPLLTKLYSFN